jgi:hypothetical protein
MEMASIRKALEKIDELVPLKPKLIIPGEGTL